MNTAAVPELPVEIWALVASYHAPNLGPLLCAVRGLAAYLRGYGFLEPDSPFIRGFVRHVYYWGPIEDAFISEDVIAGSENRPWLRHGAQYRYRHPKYCEVRYFSFGKKHKGRYEYRGRIDALNPQCVLALPCRYEAGRDKESDQIYRLQRIEKAWYGARPPMTLRFSCKTDACARMEFGEWRLAVYERQVLMARGPYEIEIKVGSCLQFGLRLTGLYIYFIGRRCYVCTDRKPVSFAVRDVRSGPGRFRVLGTKGELLSSRRDSRAHNILVRTAEFLLHWQQVGEVVTHNYVYHEQIIQHREYGSCDEWWRSDYQGYHSRRTFLGGTTEYCHWHREMCTCREIMSADKNFYLSIARVRGKKEEVYYENRRLRGSLACYGAAGEFINGRAVFVRRT